jgi:hypothetical protein
MTLIKSLTETEILSAIRKAFTGQTLEGIDIDALISSSLTLEELITNIGGVLSQRDALKP